MEGFLVGIDLGGTNIKIAIAEESGNILGSFKIPTGTDKRVEIVIPRLVRTITELLADHCVPQEKLAGIGLGLPGLVNRAGVVPILPSFGWENINVGEELGRFFKTNIFSDNDANVNALGEYSFGMGRKVKNMVMLTLGTGIGGAVIIDSKLLRGRDNYAFEVGHITLSESDEPGFCSDKGSFEAMCSATGMLRYARSQMLKEKKTILWKMTDGNPEDLTLPILCDGFDQNDPVSMHVFERTVKYLSIGVCNVIYMFNPEMIVIGGGVANCNHRIMKPLQEHVRKDLFHSGFLCDIEKTQLGDNAGAMGAVTLAQGLF